MVVGIIGAGASGMAAALAAAENKDTQVLIFERQARVGKKLLATGNGRCNLTNIHASEKHYHGQMPEFCRVALEKYGVDNTLEWFAKLGLYTVTEDSGRVYPYSDQANSVVDVLRLALDKPNITLHLGAEIDKIRSIDGMFQISFGTETALCHKLIVACGGLAGTKLGGTMAGYKLLGKLGHKSTRLRPNLVQLQSSWPMLASLKGVRANCVAQIFCDGNLYAESAGEVQFTERGLSGPVIFEISRDVCAAPGNWVCRLDLLPGWDEDKLGLFLAERTNGNLSLDDLLTGILHNRLGRVITKAAGIKGKTLCAELMKQEMQSVCRCVKSLEVSLTEPLGMDSAQVTAGGVLTEQFDPNTMESRLVKGLYACGEVLDIDGDCGGFNLQWAWSSGRLAGHYAGGNAE